MKNISLKSISLIFILTFVASLVITSGYCYAGNILKKQAAYGSDKSQTLDVYYPPAAANRLTKKLFPVVVFIHGGSWVKGDKASWEWYARDLVNKGYVAFSINYRTSDGKTTTHPTQINDCEEAIEWIRNTASKKLKIDINRIGVVGNSAGGHLVALLGTSDLIDPDNRPKCVVDYYGPTDLTQINNAEVEVNYDFYKQTIINLMGLAYDPMNPAVVQAYKDASPVWHVRKYADTNGKEGVRPEPFQIFHGTTDETVPISQSQLLDQELYRCAGLDYRVPQYYGGIGHGFIDAIDPKGKLYWSAPEMRNAAIDAWNRAVSFLDKYLKR